MFLLLELLFFMIEDLTNRDRKKLNSNGNFKKRFHFFNQTFINHKFPKQTFTYCSGNLQLILLLKLNFLLTQLIIIN